MISAQEICDNGIDDDGDGFIDLNDDECVCIGLTPTSLVPNPSFEENTCCPTQNAQLDCAVGWIQASNPTTDYVHTCEGYLGNTSIPAFAPLPFPDGEGAVGFRDGEAWNGNNFKEYVGSCLNETMEVGTNYKLDFYVGFQDNVPGSKSLSMAIFGSTNCSNLPFGGNNIIGCPTNASGYDQLGELVVSGNNEWVNVVFDFVASQPYNVIVLGPACATNPNYNSNPYFFLDRLALAESSSFGIPFQGISGQICNNNLELITEYNEEYTYQWYLDNVAIVGSTDNVLLLTATNSSEGNYKVVITTPTGCYFSQDYKLLIPPYYASDQATICENDSILVGNQYVNESGYHEITIPALDGCDSIIQFDLNLIPSTYSTLDDKFCEGEIYEYLNFNTSEAGQYQIKLLNEVGCDSIITINLEMIIKGEGVEFDPINEKLIGSTIDIHPRSIGSSVNSFTWYDEDGLLLSTESTLSNYLVTTNTSLYLISQDELGCSEIDTISIRVDDSNIKTFVPNVFSPNGDFVNDYFNIYSTSAFKQINKFEIYDRWGELIYINAGIDKLDDLRGWNGEFKGEEAPSAVYTYLIEVQYINGTIQNLSGSLTLLR